MALMVRISVPSSHAVCNKGEKMWIKTLAMRVDSKIGDNFKQCEFHAA